MLLHIVVLLSLIASIRATCNRTCGAETVPYPFGFSSECKIPLTCDAADRITIIGGDFQIRNITSGGILVDVRPSCDRPLIPAVQLFYGGNYAISSKTVLLVRNCSGGRGSPSGCVIPTSLLAQQFDLGTCGGPGGDNVTCLSAARSDTGFLTLADIEAAECKALFTAIGYESGDAQYLPSLVFRTVELGWWLDGDCRCAEDADCVTVATPANGAAGFRCACRKGFQGDGFADGDGCRRETDPSCNTSKYITGNCDGPTRIGLLIAGIVTGASLMAGLALACCALRRRRRRSSKGRGRYCSKRLLSQASCSIPLYPYRDIERATNGFAESQMLGTGAYGTVYSGKLNDDKLVAIKKIKHRDNESMDQVMNEVKLLSSVTHPNLVRLLGCCIGAEQQQILVYEFMPNGTLSQHLARERGPPLPWTVRLTIAAETAKAIAYLHSGLHHPPIYHRDIKSSNILLDHSFNSKVADFGLSRMGNLTMASHISTAPQGTPGYLDPQYHQDFHLSDKSDVYSFGVVLVEIITAMKVVDFSREGGEVNLAAMAVDKIGKGRVDEIVDAFIETGRDEWTLASIHKVAELAFRCLAFHRDMRPSMAEVADELEQVRLSGWAPQQPDDVFVSPASSLCSSASASLSNGRRLDEKAKVDSPVSVQDPWFSHRSSPSSNSLLGSAVP